MTPRVRRLLIGAGVVVGAWVVLPHLLRHVGFFRVRQVELVGVRYSAPSAVIDALRLEPNASVFDDLAALAERLRALRGIADARVVRHLPGALKVIVREVEPVALVPGANGPLVTVDAAGHPLPYDPSRVAVDLPVAASADSGLVGLLALVQSMDPTLFEEITAARASRGDVVLQLGTRRLLMARDAGPDIIRALVLVANDLQSRSRAYGELDARYAGQIVVRRAGGDGGGGLVSRDRRLVAGLDLGSTKTCAVIAEVVGDLPRSPLAKVLGVGLAKNSGVRRGVVRDIEETVRSVTAALRDAERMSGVKAAAVTCGIAGEHVSARNSSGVVAVNGDEITPADVARVNEVARAVSLGPDQELLHDIPQEYMVDQQRGISDPVGMTGMRLEVEAYLVTVQSTAAQNLRKAVQRAGYRVADLVLEPLAASYAVLTDDEKELGVALVEVGGGSTGVAIFHEGKIRHVASLKYAGAHVTNDLVQGLGVTQADAERLKERHGIAYAPLVDASEMINLPSTPGQGARQASRELLSHIIHQRLDEIFMLVGREFERAGYGGGRLPAGVVLTGGTSHLPGLVELAREVFAVPVRAGAPELGISGLVDSVQAPRYAVPVGLVLYAARRLMQGAAGHAASAGDGGVEKVLGPLKRWLQDFF